MDLPERASAHFQRAQTFAKEVDDNSSQLANALIWSGISYRKMGQHEKAQSCFEQTLPLWEELGNRQWKAHTLGLVAATHYERGFSNDALDYLRRSIRIRKNLEDWPGLAVEFSNIGRIHLVSRSYQKALKYFRRALAMAEKATDQRQVVVTHNYIGTVLYTTGRVRQSLRQFERALLIAESVGDMTLLSTTLANASRALYYATGEADRALEYSERALSLSRRVGDVSKIVSDTVDIAILLGENPSLGREAEAMPLLREAIELMKHNDVGQDSSGRSLYDLKLTLVAWSDSDPV
jgi:tetratricopeptide (TPR) repeat protein